MMFPEKVVSLQFNTNDMKMYNYLNIKRLSLMVALWFLFVPVQAQSLKIVFAGDLMGHTPQHKAARTADSSDDLTVNPGTMQWSMSAQRAGRLIISCYGRYA